MYRKYSEDIGKLKEISYKDVEFLKRFLNERGKIVSRRVSGVSSAQQRKITRAIKRARILALLPFTSAHKVG
jgi:small subunit ribosomal protein S18